MKRTLKESDPVVSKFCPGEKLHMGGFKYIHSGPVGVG